MEIYYILYYICIWINSGYKIKVKQKKLKYKI